MKRFVFVGATVLFLLTALGYPKGTHQAPLPQIDQKAYVGSEKCAPCHQSYFDSWKDSPHNKMIRPAVATGPDKTILADFSKPDPYRPFELKDVKWVIGHRWKQRFIGVVNGEEYDDLCGDVPRLRQAPRRGWCADYRDGLGVDG